MPSEKKQRLVQELVQLVKDHPVVGLVNLENLPAQQLQRMRQMLGKSGVSLRMARKSLLSLALQRSGKEHIEQLTSSMTGLPALLVARANPFSLYKTIQKNKSKAPAKPGQKAPRDLVVKAGPTNFAPGPIISELAAVGIKTKVEGGKLAVIQDTIIVHEGEEISQKVAETLKRLDIQPMEIGLDVVSVWENGVVFGARQLHVDEAEYLNNFLQAAQWAMNLAIEAAYPTSETMEMLVQKAFRDAKALALEQEILADLVVEDLVERSERQARALTEMAGITIPERDPKERKEEERPVRAAPSRPEPREEALAATVREEPAPMPEPAEPLQEMPIPKGVPVMRDVPKDIPQKNSIITNAPQAADPAAAMVQAMREFESSVGREMRTPKKKAQPSAASAESLVADELQRSQGGQRSSRAEKDAMQETEQLYEELKKKGTLR